jgi:hypothetical protein
MAYDKNVSSSLIYAIESGHIYGTIDTTATQPTFTATNGAGTYEALAFVNAVPEPAALVQAGIALVAGSGVHLIRRRRGGLRS